DATTRGARKPRRFDARGQLFQWPRRLESGAESLTTETDPVRRTGRRKDQRVVGPGNSGRNGEEVSFPKPLNDGRVLWRPAVHRNHPPVGFEHRTWTSV